MDSRSTRATEGVFTPAPFPLTPFLIPSAKIGGNMNLKAHHKFVHRGERYVLNIEAMEASIVGGDTWAVLHAAPCFVLSELSPEANRDLRRLDLIASRNKEEVP